MKTLFLSLIASMVLLAGGPNVVFAGAKYSYPVVVTSTYFKGAMGSARNSDNIVERIGCGVRYVGVGSSEGICTGVDSRNNWRRCMTSDPEHIDAIQSITDSSFLLVYYIGVTCTDILVYNNSKMEPPND